MKKQSAKMRKKWLSQIVASAGKRKTLSVWLFALLLAASAGAQGVPRVSGATLSGRAIVLPDAVRGKRAVFILSFTKGASGECRAWLNRLKSEYPSREVVPVYMLPVLEDVPKFVRGMVVRSIKKDIGAEGAEITVPVFSGESEWQKVVNYGKGNEAYVLVLGMDGRVKLVVHGGVDAGIAAVSAALK